MVNTKKILICLAAISLFSPAISHAGNNYSKKSNTAKNKSLDYSAMPDGMWVTNSGTVTKTSLRGFEMNSGKKKILVEMDDWDSFKEGIWFKVGDKVTVHGEIDNDFFEKSKIEADRVMVQNTGTIYYANSVDEEDYPEWHDTFYSVTTVKPIDGYIAKTGMVTKIKKDSFVLNVNGKKYNFDVEKMPFNPLDGKGYVKVKKGDTVSVTGILDEKLFSKDEIKADYLVTLKI
jgi:uncharacterized protein YdeI (BOF family)